MSVTFARFVNITTRAIGKIAGWNRFARKPEYVLKLLGMRGGIRAGEITLNRFCRYPKQEFDGLLFLIDLVRIDQRNKIQVVKKVKIDPPEKVTPIHDYSELNVSREELIRILRRRTHNLILDLRGINDDLELYQIKREEVEKKPLPAPLSIVPEIKPKVILPDKIDQIDAGESAPRVRAVSEREIAEEKRAQIQKARPERIRRKISFKTIINSILFYYYKLKIKILSYLEKRGLYRAKQQQIKLMDYKNALGEKIIGIIDYPENSSRTKEIPWIIIPPAYGKRKETYFLLALYLKKNGFGVIRYDDSCGPGESDGEIENTTLSKSALNITATLDFVSQKLKARKIGLVPFSLAARPAIKVAASDKRIDFLFPIVGAPDIEGLLSRVYGENLIADYKGDKRRGLLNVLGFFIDSDNFLGDAVQKGFSDMDSAKKDMAKIKIPVVWFCGEQDPWVDVEQVEEVLAAHPDEGSVLKAVIPGLSHRFREAEKAHEVFTEAVRVIRQMLLDEKAFEVRPPKDKEIIERGALERSRIQVQITKEQEVRRWERYLEGFDVLTETDEYMEYMETLVNLINFQPGEKVADMGCGPGYFEEYLATKMTEMILEKGITIQIEGKIVGVDIVGKALEKTRAKIKSKREKCERLPEAEFHELDIDVSPLKTIERFNKGEIELEDLNWLPGLNLDWKAIRDRSKLRSYIRGDLLLDLVGLVEIGGERNVSHLIELDRASRFLRHRLMDEDLNEKGRVKGIDYAALDCSDLKFERLKLGESGLNISLPFESGSFDKIVASLLLSYLRNPRDIIKEFKRITKEDGAIILTSLKPDADISLIYARFLEKLKEKFPAEEQKELLEKARRLFNEAIGWIEAEEESGRFKYYSASELKEMLEEDNSIEVQVYESLGGLATIAVGKKKKIH